MLQPPHRKSQIITFDMDKLKVLLVGACSDQTGVPALSAKLKALQASKAGPFDAVLIAGPVHPDVLEQDPPLPLYLQDESLLPENAIKEGIARSRSLSEKREEEKSEQMGASGPPSDNHKLITLRDNNIFLLRNWENLDSGGVWSLALKAKKPPLVIAACSSRIRVDDEKSKLMEQISHVSYTGCDILLSSQGPQGLEQYGIEGSYDVAAVALAARARYHVCSSHSGKFVQSPPFAQLKATTNTVSIRHPGRVLALGSVVPGKVEKAYKYIHALGLKPLHYSEPEAPPSNLLPNPFTDDSYERDASKSTLTSSVGLSQASARRILREEGGRGSDHRWAQKRERDEGPPSPEATTLFFHGLHRDVRGILQGPQGDALLLRSLSKWGATHIRRPQNATFCFADFGSHEDALACHSSLGGLLSIQGIDLDVKWASSKEGDGNKRIRLTEKEAQDSSTLRYKARDMGSLGNVETGEKLRVWMEETLEKALAGDGNQVVKAADEPALQVQCRVPNGADTFGFLEFASHAAASMALATLTGSTDGGQVLDDKVGTELKFLSGGLYLNWAKGAKADDVILDESGFTFTRQHFPADGRKDCWFCLASEDCEKHLITGVYQQCYAAMPKGPVHDAHILLVPVQHSSKGIWQDSEETAEEIENVKRQFREYVGTKYDSDLFVYERAIQTKGGYHTHVQCIPVPRGSGPKIETTMLAQARRAGMEVIELNSDLSPRSVLTGEDCEEGYFYAEFSSLSGELKRFIYKHDRSVAVPLQFGREVLAAVLQKQELSHWKSCVVDRDTEAEVATTLRNGFHLKLDA